MSIEKCSFPIGKLHVSIETLTVCYGKKTIKKIPAQPSYNPQHKQKCETFVSTRLDNN